MSGWSPRFTQIDVQLFTACMRAEPDLVARALEAGARIDIPDGEGMGPLHVLAEGRALDGPRAGFASRYERCARLLIDAGADPGAGMADESARTPAQLAASKGAAGALRVLLAMGFPAQGALWRAAAEAPSVDAVAALLEAGLDPRERGPDGSTALEAAAKRWGGPVEGVVETLSAALEARELREQLGDELPKGPSAPPPRL